MMTMNKPFIKLFRASSGYYIYDVNTNSVLKVKEDLYSAIQKLIKYGSKEIELLDKKILNEIKALQEDGYLKPNNISEIINPFSSTYKSYLHHKMGTLILEVTQKCNFRCKYCSYSSDEFFDRNHNSAHMTFDMAKNAIDLYFKNSVYNNEKSICFYGGEPLIEFDLIKKCVIYANSKFSNNNKKITYKMTTNLSLISVDMIKFFSANEFYISVSLDGWAEYHDKNRRLALNPDKYGTHNIVYNKVKMIHQMRDKYPLHITFHSVYDGSVPRSKLEEYFQSDMILSNYDYSINMMDSNDVNNYFTSSDNDMLIYAQLELLKIYFSDIEKHKNKELNNKYDYILNGLKTHDILPCKCSHGGPCIPGYVNLYVTSQGIFFPCEKFPHNASCAQIGSLEEGFDYDKIYRLLNFGKLSEENCKVCWAIRLCSLCPIYGIGGETLSKSVKLKRCNYLRESILRDLKDLCALKYLKTKNIIE